MTPGLLGGLFSRGPDEQALAELDTRLEEFLTDDEQVQYRLPGKATLVHEDGTASRAVDAAEGTLAVVTDHRVLLAALDGEATVFDLPHTDIRGVILDSGLFRTVLTVEHWDDGIYQFRPAGGEVSAAVAYIERASDCWQFVETLLDELDGHAESIEAAIEAGQFDRVEAVLGEASDTTAELDERVQEAGLEAALGDRVDEARRTLQRTRVETRVALARSLVAEAESRHLNGEADIDYTGAHDRYVEARDHLSTAATIAAEYDLDGSEVGRVRERLDERVSLLARQPVALAKQARERAVGTDDDAVRVETMRAALEHYRDALSVGWGSDIESPYDRDDLRFRVALLADGLVDAHREYAASLEAAGDALATGGNDDGTAERYRAAIEQLDAALALAGEFHAPDPEPIERERARLERKVEECAAAG